jgi:hypothetical protein
MKDPKSTKTVSEESERILIQSFGEIHIKVTLSEKKFHFKYVH